MNNDNFISTYIKSRLALAEIDADSIKWIAGGYFFGISPDAVPADDPNYPVIRREGCYVSFDAKLSYTAVCDWGGQALLNQQDKSLFLDSLLRGTHFYVTRVKGVPTVNVEIRKNAIEQEKWAIGIVKDYITGKLHALRTLIAEEIDYIVDTGLSTKVFSSDEERAETVQDVLVAFGHIDKASVA